MDGRYEIYEFLGQGGTAYVYKAFDNKEKQNVALKILKSEFSNNLEFIRRFRYESKAIRALSHRGIVKVFEVNIGSKIQYIVMEFLDGITLKDFIKFQKEVNIKLVLNIIKQILNALNHSHSNGIVHRDIKPQNIIILKENVVKVTDFGIARFLTCETKTITNKSLGTVHYVSPEQARGDVIDVRSDIYSVGIILYEMLTQSLPFEAENDFSVALMQMQLDPRSPVELNKNIPLELEKIILKSMKKNVYKRYQTVTEMLEDIKEFELDSDINFKNRWLGNSSYDEKNENKIGENSDSKEKNKSKKSIMVASGVFATFLVFTLAFMFLSMFTSYGLNGAMRDVDIPDFTGLHLSDIENENYKFHWKIESVYDAKKEQGTILAQDPAPNSKKVKAGSTIILKVNSSGILVEVPQISGLSSEVGTIQLMNAGLKSEIRAINDENKPVGIIIHSDPPEGTKIMIDSTVVLYVSKGPVEPVIPMPNFLGYDVMDAKKELSNKTQIIYEKSDMPKNKIISSDPLPGVNLHPNDVVTYRVSSGIKRERTVEIPVPLPPTRDPINLDIYVNGTHQQRVRVDPVAIDVKVFQFTGNSGTIEVRVKINDQIPYRRYVVNFDTGTFESVE